VFRGERIRSGDNRAGAGEAIQQAMAQQSLCGGSALINGLQKYGSDRLYLVIARRCGVSIVYFHGEPASGWPLGGRIAISCATSWAARMVLAWMRMVSSRGGRSRPLVSWLQACCDCGQVEKQLITDIRPDVVRRRPPSWSAKRVAPPT